MACYRRPRQATWLCAPRRDSRLSLPLVRVLGLQVGHRQNRNGLWGFQTPRGDWSLVRLRQPVTSDPALVYGGRPGWRKSDCFLEACSPNPHSIWTLSCRCGFGVPAVGAPAGGIFPRALRGKTCGSVPMKLVVAVTGGIGSGKSTAAKLFETLGAGLVDTDAIAQQLTLPGQQAVERIRKRVGDS